VDVISLTASIVYALERLRAVRGDRVGLRHGRGLGFKSHGAYHFYELFRYFASRHRSRTVWQTLGDSQKLSVL